MNIVIIGYGRMGHEVEEAALSRGHSITLIIDKDNTSDLRQEKFDGVDAAIEFTVPETAFSNISACLGFKIPVVSGTTGWMKDYDKTVEICKINNTSFIHSSNFSIGVNLFFRLNKELARYIATYSNYSVRIEEIHHTAKLDAPSGTAISLAKGIQDMHPYYSGWCFESDKNESMIPVSSVREGNITGTHTVTWDSDADIITLRHEAKNRKGLALGAVLAAEYIYNRKGVFTMDDVLGF